MKIAVFKTDGENRLGIVTSGGIFDVKKAANLFAESNTYSFDPNFFYSIGLPLLPVLADIALKSKAEPSLFHPIDSIEYSPVVPNPGKIICIGLNYRKHAFETGMNIPVNPVVFGKFNNTLSPHMGEVHIPSSVVQIDYEAELAVVIGRRCESVSGEEALSCVLGYTCANDLSARDAQNLTSQWMLGKSLDGFCPLGPHIVTSDEAGDIQSLGIRSFLNGEKRQDSNTSDMIFSVPELVSFLSRYWTLLPGDVILTGTPEGVIMGKKEKVWMKKGDTVTVEIDGIGSLTSSLL